MPRIKPKVSEDERTIKQSCRRQPLNVIAILPIYILGEFGAKPWVVPQKRANGCGHQRPMT